MTTRETEKSREELQIVEWNKNLEKFKNGEFGAYKTFPECTEALVRYWKAQAEAGYPGANDNFMYFLQSIGGKKKMNEEKRIDDMTIAVLQCYRNKYKDKGNDTEEGLIANAINDVLPTLFAVKNEDYRKASEVVEGVFDWLEEKGFLNIEVWAIQDVKDELKKKYTEEEK